MKIAIIGTHSTGKTTLCKLLLAELHLRGLEAYLLPEFARLCPHPINEATTLEAQEWIQNEQMKQEGMYCINNRRFVICDRATIDNFAYMQQAAARDGVDVSAAEQRAVWHTSTYDVVFKTRKLDLAAKADGVRTTDGAFRDAIDARIHDLLDKHQVPHHMLLESLDYKAQVELMLKKIEALP